MKAAGLGDARAFDEIVLRHQQAAWNVAVRFLENSEAASDVVQDAFLRIWDAASRYQPTAQFRTYLFRIVCRLCIDCTRRKKPLPVENLPDLPDPTPSAMENLLLQERAIAVRQALLQLPDSQRMAIIMRYYEQCGYTEIAEALNITEKAAERLLSRGRKRLETLLIKWLRE
ncbi:sigma-70 family RNA polymerase sigma factor [candidate division KSB1 bacterium]|nr:MAG: sigma-70 family RNA polymerase sigma factor [candidate division KSB1 bacterium]